jgi:uncharacterized protein (TIGR02147 family)
MNGQQLLTREFENRKKQNPAFSLRSFARWLGLSPAQTSQVMSGKRPLTVGSIEKISARLALSPVEKRKLLASLLGRKSGDLEASGPVKTQTLKRALEEDHFRLIGDWYHLAILSLTRVHGAKADPRWIASRLGIRVEDANLAVQRLVRIGLLETFPKFRQIGEPFQVVSHVPSEAIRRYHKQVLMLAAEKIDTVPLELRQLQSISIPMRISAVAKLKPLIDEFLDEAASLAASDSPEEIYNLNVQLVPITLVKKAIHSQKEKK